MDLPSATTTLFQDSAANDTSASLLTVLAPVSRNADSMPWLVGSARALFQRHGYCPAVDFVAAFIMATKLPVLFVPMAIATPGVVSRQNVSGNTGSSVVSVAVGSYGSLEEVDGQVRVVSGGTVGTDQIVLEYTLDPYARSWKTVRLGASTSFVIPSIGQTVSLTVGTLVADDVVLTWHSTAPMWDNTGLTAAKVALEAQSLKSRAWYIEGAITNSTFAGYVTTAANAYLTECGRSIVAKCALPDRLPYAELAQVRARMVLASTSTCTFAEVGGTGDTITRNDGGSFLTDGFVTGDTIRVTGATTAGNNVTCVPATFAAGVLTMGSTDLIDETKFVAITSEPTITFVDGGGSDDTITRNRGSWLDDGFRTGDVITIVGTVSNNYSATLTNVTATTLTVATGTVTAEAIGSYGVSITAGQTLAEHLIAMNAAMASVVEEERIDIGHGRASVLSPALGFMMRRNANYFDTIRSFQHDIHVATWAVANGPLEGAKLDDGAGNIVEHDERVNTGALAAGFTCLRTWAEKPAGSVYVARSVTRAAVGTVLAATENMYVACLAQNVAQETAVDVIGSNLVLNDDGTATSESLASITDKIDSAEKRNLLANKKGEGARASNVTVTLNTGEDLTPDDAVLSGVVDVKVNGKIAHMALNVYVH